MSAVGIDFTMNMAWEGLIRHSLRNNQKNNFQTQRVSGTWD